MLILSMPTDCPEAQNGKGEENGSLLGNAQPSDDGQASSDMIRELAWYLVEKVDRLGDPEMSSEVQHMEQWGDFVRSLRRQRGMSRTELAAQTGLPLSFLIALENGLLPHEALCADRLRQLADGLSVPLDVLKIGLIETGQWNTRSPLVQRLEERGIPMRQKNWPAKAVMPMHRMKGAILVIGMLLAGVAMKGMAMLMGMLTLIMAAGMLAKKRRSHRM